MRSNFSRSGSWLLIIMFSCAGDAGPHPPPSDLQPSRQVMELFGGAEAIETVLNATSVQAYRLTTPAKENVERIDKLSDYTMTAGPIGVSHATVAQLRKVLMDDSTLVWEAAVACGLPDYGVRFQFLRGNDSLDVLLCFHCDQIGIYHNGNFVGQEECDGGRAELVRIVQELFPDDPIIQALKHTELAHPTPE